MKNYEREKERGLRFCKELGVNKKRFEELFESCYFTMEEENARCYTNTSVEVEKGIFKTLDIIFKEADLTFSKEAARLLPMWVSEADEIMFLPGNDVIEMHLCIEGDQ